MVRDEQTTAYVEALAHLLEAARGTAAAPCVWRFVEHELSPLYIQKEAK